MSNKARVAQVHLCGGANARDFAEGEYAPLARNAANDTARAAMDGGENRHPLMDERVAVPRRSRRESIGAFGRSQEQAFGDPAKGTGRRL